VYTEEERSIYCYHDGRRPRRADPLALEAAYFAAMEGMDRAGLDDQLASPVPEVRSAASARLLPAIRAAFGVAELDEDTGEGLPLAETFGLTRAFFRWKAEVRSEYRQLARHVALFGHPPGRALDYRAFCGLTWNAERLEAVQAVQVARGIVSALTGKAHPSLVDAMAETEAQVPWVQLVIESEKAEADQAANIAAGRI
jgi:hypothetical protein